MSTEFATAPRLFSVDWVRERLHVLKSISVGMVTWPVGLAVLLLAWPAPDVATDAASRIAYALQLGVAPAFFVFAANMGCMRLFDTKDAENPFLNAESQGWKVNARVLQNTIEQLAIFLPMLFGLAVRVAPEHLRILPIAVTLWCTGRVLFWVGYRVDPLWRGPGFDWTINSAVLVGGWFVYTLF